MKKATFLCLPASREKRPPTNRDEEKRLVPWQLHSEYTWNCAALGYYCKSINEERKEAPQFPFCKNRVGFQSGAGDSVDAD